MTSGEKYKNLVIDLVNKIYDDAGNKKNIEKAADLIADATNKGEMIYIIGTGGHSNLVAEECMCRAGVLANINPMIDATNLFNGTVKSRMLQRNPKYASGVLDQYYIPEGSILIIVNAYGINALTIELALEAKRRGLIVIGVSSPDHFENTPEDQAGRHPSKKNLFECVDIPLNCYMPFGDAAIEVAGCEQPVGPVATITNVFIVESLIIRAIEKAIEKGGNPDVWRSINIPGGDEYDANLFKKYGCRIKYLL